MAEVGNKLIDLKSMRAVIETIEAAFESYQNYFDEVFQNLWNGLNALHDNKLNAPEVNGTVGQVLTLKDDQGNTEWKDMPGNVDVVRQSTHHTDYTRDTLEFVTDSTGKVTNVYFMSK